MASGESEKLIEAVADRAREALEGAESQAQEIVAQAEARAEEIVASAEARANEIEADADAKAQRTVALSEDQARERIERARKALDELGVALGNEPTAAEAKAGSDPSPAETPEPAEAQGSDPSPASIEEPAEDPEPASPGSPTTDELIAQLKGTGSPPKPAGDDGDGPSEAAVRLVAMNMALDGSSREEVDAHLTEEFGPGDRDALLDEVFERAGG